MISSKHDGSDFKFLNDAKVGDNGQLFPMKSQKFVVEAIEAAEQLWTLIDSRGPLDEKVEELYCKARSAYENAIFEDNESSENYDVRLWLLHYRLIEEFRGRIRACSQNTSVSGLANPQNPRILQENCVGILNGFQKFLAKSTEFYEEMILKLKEYYGIPGECSFGSIVHLDGLETKALQKFQLLCHRCFIYLGDLGRYKELYASPEISSFNLSIATRYYLNASLVYPASGNPHNQLALVAMYIGDELQQMYHLVRSFAIADPFLKARDNLFSLFNNLMLTDQHKPSKEVSLGERNKESGASHSESMVCDAAAMGMSKEANFMANFGYPFAKLVSMLCTNTRSDELSDSYTATLIGLEKMLLLDDAKLEAILHACQPMGIDVTNNSAFRIIQLVCILIFAILCENLEFQLVRCEHERRKDITQLAWAAAFDIMGHVIYRCVKYSSFNDSPLLPGVLVFMEWSALGTDLSKTLDEADEKCANAAGHFFSCLVEMLNEVCDRDDISHQSTGAYKLSDNDILWEDHELWAFSPLLPIHGSTAALTCISGKKMQDKHEYQVRSNRIVAAAMKLVHIFSTSNHKWINYNEMENRFYAFEAGKENEKTESIDDMRLRKPDQLLVRATERESGLVSESIVAPEETNSDCQSCIGEEDEVIIFKPAARNCLSSDLVYYPEATDLVNLHSVASRTTPCKLTREQTSELDDFSSVFHPFSASLGHNEVYHASHSDRSEFKNGEIIKSERLLADVSALHPLSDLRISSTLAEQREDQMGYGLLQPKNYVHERGLPSRVASPSLRGWIVSKDKIPAPSESLLSTSSLNAGWTPAKAIHSADTASITFPESSSLFGTPLPTSNYSCQLNFENRSAAVPEYFSATGSPYVTPLPSAPLLTEENITHIPDPATYPREYVNSILSFPRHFPVSSAPQDLLAKPGTTGFVGLSNPSDKFYRNWLLTQGFQGASSGYGGYPCPTPPAIHYFHQYKDIIGTRCGDDISLPERYYSSYYDATFREPDVLKKPATDRWMNPSGPALLNFQEGSYRDLSTPYSYNAIDQRGKEAVFNGYQSAATVRYSLGLDERTEQILHSQYPTDLEWYRQRQHV